MGIGVSMVRVWNGSSRTLGRFFGLVFFYLGCVGGRVRVFDCLGLRFKDCFGCLFLFGK